MFKALKLTAKAKLSHGGISLSVGAVMVCLLTAAAGNYLSYLIGLLGSLIPGIEQTGFLLPVIQGIFCAAAMFFFSPLFLGCYRLFLLIARDEQPKLSEIFYYGGNGLYKCALKFSFSLLIRVLARLLISFLPLLVVVALFVFTPLKNTTNPIVGAAVFSIFIVLGLILFVYLCTSLFYAPTAFTMMPQINTNAHFRRSKEICQNQKGNIILFYLSFIPWYLLGFFIIPILWITPYFFVTMIIFSFYLENKYKNKFKTAVNQNIHVANTSAFQQF